VIDLYRHAEYLADHASLAVAERFLKSAERTISRLARTPGQGAPWESNHPRLADLRVASVEGFRNHLIFYRPQPDHSIEVVRVLHAAQDIASILGQEEVDP
jgi:toxin ParE1/3/4